MIRNNEEATVTTINLPPGEVRHRHGRSGVALFAMGFRPFFLCAGLAAVAIMAIWLLAYTRREPLLSYYGSSGWHAHEMLFGYMAAVIAGFLLTAVGNWTNRPTVSGIPLALLAVLWLAGRVLPVMPSIPPWLVAAVDFSFLPALLICLAVPLLRAGQRNNYFVIPVLAVLIAANALVHGEWLGYAGDTARLGIVLAAYAVVLLITIIAGRVIPFFIERGIDGAKPRRWPVIEYASVMSVILLALADLFSPSVKAVAVCASLAAVVHVWRWCGWWVTAAWSKALLWVLLAGYAWLIAGFILLAFAYGGFISPMIAFHALMVGGFGGLTLGIMARVALGHTGRALQVSSPVVMSFVILNLASVMRVLGPLLSSRYAQAMITAAGALWIISFALFLLVYAPILVQARADGRPG